MLEDQAFEYLYDRAGRHDLTVTELLSRTPSSVSDSYVEAAEFWKNFDISHEYPQSTHPELSDVPSNVFAEDPSANRSRGAEVATQSEIDAAAEHAEAVADAIDAYHTDDLIVALV